MLNPSSSNERASAEEGRKGSFLQSALNKSGMNKDQVVISTV